MNLSEFISFIITLGLFIFLMFRRAVADRRRQRNPELAAEEKMRDEEELERYLRDLHLNVEDENFPEELRPEELRPQRMRHKKPKPPPKRVLPPPMPAMKKIEELPNLAFNHTYEIHSYEIRKKNLVPRAEKLIKELPELKNMLIYYEIFGPPKALRKD